MSRNVQVRTGPFAPPVPEREPAVESADGARLHVEVHGAEGAPAVVLAHGWTCSTAFWAAQVRSLARDHRVIVYDQRGHGRSPAHQLPYSTDMLADDLEAVLAATLAPGERAVVAGHSMGGMTIMAAAGRERFREHAAAVLLCSTGSSRLVAESTVVPLLPASALRTRLTRAILGSKAPLGPVTPLAKRILRYATMGPASAGDRVEVCARIVHACPRQVRHGWSQVLDGLQLDAGVGELTMPVAVVGGTADRMTPIALARRIAAGLPDCVGLTELPGLGHMTPIEAPEAITDRIRALVEDYVQREKGSDVA
ncbi:alpha/beta fold hydrolase [Streptomyces sp. VRA16 Mangrove soil]|uniref:alpha/beta fold hydrolase n=1 Tax=Streptomyces sp. VRA16 Mangrove soil TaxID=2817434 RepID=UPI001A9F2F7B|nr:alpha/beta hydrolase [Streptomyces sp. VRA16 Mangrove soil]MBO1336497.1 alpha/beta hydrolase [Streptomyces sp. VRA16 Mangrove soil]